MRGQMNRKPCIYKDMKLLVVSWWQNCQKAPEGTHIHHNTAKSNLASHKLKEKNCLLWKGIKYPEHCVILTVILLIIEVIVDT